MKNITPKGCFILLSRKLDAKILISNLSDGYVKDLEKEFPVGKLVTGRQVIFFHVEKKVPFIDRIQFSDALLLRRYGAGFHLWSHYRSELKSP